MSTLQISRYDKILDTATELFKQNGFAGTSMRDLAEAVGLEAGSLYSHVESKEELLHLICFGIAGKFTEQIDEVLQTANCSNTEKLEMAIEGHMRIITEDLNATAVLWNEWKFLKEPGRTELSELQVNYEHKFKSILDAGVEACEFTIQDTQFTTMALLSSLNGLQKWRSYSLPPEELGCAYSDLFIKGIKQ